MSAGLEEIERRLCRIARGPTRGRHEQVQAPHHLRPRAVEGVAGAALDQVFELVDARAGTYEKVGQGEKGTLGATFDERVEKKDDYLVYVRRARFQKFPGVIEVQWVLTASKGIAGVFFSPEKTP